MAPIIAPEPPHDRWSTAAKAADLFRGAFIRQHARGETLISEALLALREASPGTVPTLPQWSGQRLSELRKIVEARITGCGHLKHVLTVLDAFQTFEGRRNCICHGAATLLLDQQGKWALGYQLLSFKANVPVRSSMFLSQSDATALIRELDAAVDRLPAALGHVRKLQSA